MAAYFELLKAKTERLKICNGYWHRVVTPVVLKENRQTAIFIDPPYDPKIRDGRLYSNESNVSKEAYAWAIAHGNHPNLRIAFCYYEGEHEFPADWEIYSWQANGGMANQNKDKDNENNRKERIAFSKYCIRPMERLF
jgi:site-specific DNA-adenine methylase